MLLLEGETSCGCFDWPKDSGVEYAVMLEGVRVVAGRDLLSIQMLVPCR